MQPDRRFVWRVEAAPRKPGISVTTKPRERSVRHSCRVLVVDDDVLIRAQLCALLHESDYEVETAASGEDALQLLRSYPCDIVVTDWQMPLMDGVTLCRQVRSMEQHEHVYMLMLTVKKSPQELLAGFAAGADDYVVKGTSSEELLARLEKGRSLANWRATYRSNDDDAGDLSLMDAATGAYNLAYLMRHLPREMARAERYSRSLAVVSCDIGGMARVNPQCDDDEELLRGFVSRSTASIRQGDWLARTGAHEFMIVLPETDRKGARSVAAKLAEAFACQQSPTTEQPIGSAISIHVTAMEAQGDGDGVGAASLRALLRKAESLQQGDKNEAIRAPSAQMHYLIDLVSGGDADRGRNWPTA